ncbi:MAG: DUF3103 family protein [Runella slithyformis]|nr:MAG: DUF3103 family protein [Runella slithyformis]TAF24883.1 MAG: DUF3103 family protein [Runella slithyformis]TAF48905.1 MAG: DUF3103 family protein [Runella slithyformis]TAF79512.1 MAG: DUF3103 family protein [Runella slithyformis]TAH14850.1 MAG: DUF3103 family protein [Runella slithyformis]
MKNLCMTKIAGLFLSIGFVWLLSSCGKNNESVSPASEPVELTTLKDGEYDPMLEEVAKAVAGSLNEVSMRIFIKDEALKKFDGDYDILYRNVQNKIVNGQSVKSIFSTSARNNASREIPLDLGKILAKYPLLNISVPVNVEKWDANSYEPLVVVIPNIKDESKLDKIKAYDKRGNVHWLDAQKVPNVPVIAVGINERTTLQPNGVAVVRTDFLKTTFRNGRTSLEEELPPIENGGSGGGSTSCTAPYSSNMVLKGYKSENIGAIESWANGAPEIRMSCSYTNQSGTAINLHGGAEGALDEPNYRSMVDNTWWNFTNTLFTWQSSYGDLVDFVLWEEDAGTIVDTPVTIKGKFAGVELSASFNIKVTNNDERIGTFTVYRENICNNQTYGTTALRFRLGY